MRMLEILEGDRDRLTEDIRRARTAREAVPVIEKEFDRLLFRFNEECSDESVRDAAAAMTETARMSVRLSDTVGETKIWESLADTPSGRDNRKNGKMTGIPLIAAGIICIILAVFIAVMKLPGSLEGLRSIVCAVLGSAGGVCILIGGRRNKAASESAGSGNRDRSRPGQRMVEVSVDPQKTYRILHAVVQVIDKNLDEIQSRAQWESRVQTEENAGENGALTPEAVILYSDLLEAVYSEDGEYALEKAAQVRYFLHSMQVEVVDCNEETKLWFDHMPAKRTGTIRPALVRNGKVLRKGIAAGGL
ncbi:MAG: hypothetical protein K6C06_07480 [Lachnospiraceae bacterium]|nr:hypothetical protein [Lachnospiraceae bacterium]